MRIDAAERRYLVKVGHRLSTARLSTGQCLLQSRCSSGTVYRSKFMSAVGKRVNWVNLTPPEILSACNLGMELIPPNLASVSHCRNALSSAVWGSATQP